jgi:hypothetical protein
METIPKSLRYSELVPKSIKSSVSTVQYLPNNGSSFTAGQVIRIPVAAASQFLDTRQSFLSFDVSATATAGGDGEITFDAGGHGCFTRLRVLAPSGVEIERIDDYPTITALLGDVIRSYGNYTSGGAILEGVHYEATAQRAVVADGTPQTTRFSIPFHVSSFGSLATKLIPMPILNGGFIFELTVNSAVNACVAANAVSGFTVSNLAYNASLVSVPTDFMQMFMSVVQKSGLVMSCKGFRNYVSQLAGGTNGTNTIRILDSLRSVNSVFTILRRNTAFAQAVHTLTSHGREGATTYQYKINQQPIPSAPVNLSGAITFANVATSGNFPADAYGEVLKSMWRVGDSSIGAGITPAQYVADSSIALINTNYAPKFVIAVDLDAYRDAILSGFDMSKNASEILLTLTGSAGNACQADTFLMYDYEMVIDPMGNMNVNL